MGSLQRRANKEVSFGTQQAFTLQPSNSPVVSLWGGVESYFQGDGNFVVSVSLPPSPFTKSTHPSSHTHPTSTTRHSPLHVDAKDYSKKKNSYNGNAIWSSNTAGHSCESGDTCRLAWQGDGNLVVYVNGAALWSSATAGRGELLRFTAQSYAVEITGVESEGSAPVLWRTPETGNQPDPGPGGPGVCDGVGCFSCSDCVVSSE